MMTHSLNLALGDMAILSGRGASQHTREAHPWARGRCSWRVAIMLRLRFSLHLKVSGGLTSRQWGPKSMFTQVTKPHGMDSLLLMEDALPSHPPTNACSASGIRNQPVSCQKQPTRWAMPNARKDLWFIDMPQKPQVKKKSLVRVVPWMDARKLVRPLFIGRRQKTAKIVLNVYAHIITSSCKSIWCAWGEPTFCRTRAQCRVEMTCHACSVTWSCHCARTSARAQ